MKTCKQCSQTKSLEEYYNHYSNIDGKYNICKDCFKANGRIRFQKAMQNPEYREKRRLKAERERYAAVMKEIRRIRKNAKAREKYRQKKENDTIYKTQ